MATPSLFPVWMLAQAGDTTILGADIKAVVGGPDIVAKVGPALVAKVGSGNLRARISSAISAIVPSGQIRAVISSDDLNAEVK